jgi:urease accessory protein
LSDAIIGDELNRDWPGRIKRAEPLERTRQSGNGNCRAGHERRDAFAVQQYGVATTILGAALRLMRMSFVDTQRILLDATATVAPAYEEAADATIEDMACFAPMTDILAAVHVKGHVRMFELAGKA